jgi:hypothetical protein
MNTPISFPIAKLLKEKGFDLPAQKYYEHALKSVKNKEDGYSGPFGWKKGELNLQTDYFVNNSKTADLTSEMWYMCSAPTIADVVMWFKDVKKIQLFLDFNYYDGFHYGIKYVISNGKFGEIWRDNNEYPDGYDSWEEAYEAAFEYILKELI